MTTTTVHRIVAIAGAVLLALVLSAALAAAQTGTAPTTGANYVAPNDSLSGQSMLGTLIASHREAIRLSRSTARVSSNADIRRFAQQTVETRTGALNTAIALSDRLGYTRGDTLTMLSSTMTPVDSGLGAGLSALADASADRAYLSSMISSDENLLTVLRTRAMKVTDPAVRAMAIETRTSLEGQVAEARKLEPPTPAPAAGQ